MKKAGFSLAEVLIALSIIGMISLLTVPKMVEDTNIAKYEAGTKKAFAGLNNVVTYANKNKLFPLQSSETNDIIRNVVGPVIPVSHVGKDYFIGSDGLAYQIEVFNKSCGNAPVFAEEIFDYGSHSLYPSQDKQPCLRVYVNSDGQNNFTTKKVATTESGKIDRDSVGPVSIFWVYKNGVVGANEQTRAVLTSQYMGSNDVILEKPVPEVMR